MRKWTKESAERALAKYSMPDNKVIYLNGEGTLMLCSAADYLVKNSGYMISAEKRKEKGN